MLPPIEETEKERLAAGGKSGIRRKSKGWQTAGEEEEAGSLGFSAQITTTSSPEALLKPEPAAQTP